MLGQDPEGGTASGEVVGSLLGPETFQEALIRPRRGAPPGALPGARRERGGGRGGGRPMDSSAPPALPALPPAGASQLFSICSMSSSPSREQGLLQTAPWSRQAVPGSPRPPQPSPRAQPPASSQHGSSWQAGWSSRDGGRGSGIGVPAGVLPPVPEAESKAVQDLVLLTWRAKGL